MRNPSAHSRNKYHGWAKQKQRMRPCDGFNFRGFSPRSPISSTTPSCIRKGSRYSDEHLHGPSKLLHLVAGKSSRYNSNGSKKHLAKSLKKTLRLYTLSSTELVNLLLEYLLNALHSSSLADDSRFSSSTEDKQTAFERVHTTNFDCFGLKPFLLWRIFGRANSYLLCSESLESKGE